MSTWNFIDDPVERIAKLLKAHGLRITRTRNGAYIATGPFHHELVLSRGFCGSAHLWSSIPGVDPDEICEFLGISRTELWPRDITQEEL